MDENSKITPIGIINFRNTNQMFGIKDNDRLGHIYVIGKTGVGKSTLLLNMAISDIERGNGLCIIDPHGDLSEELLKYIPKNRNKETIYFNAADLDYPIAFNPLYGVNKEDHHIVTSGLISTFKKIWADSWGPRLEYILRFCLLTLLNYPEATLLDIQPLLTDNFFRERVLLYCHNPHIQGFWNKEFNRYSPALKAEAIAPILNKTGLFLSSIPLRNIVGQKVKSFGIQEILDTGKIFIVNLAKGIIGEDASSLLGSVLVTSMQLAAMHRAREEEQKRKPFYLYIDECHSFITLSFIDILSEARKYKLSLFLSHQYIEQIQEKVCSAIFGNVGTIISFRIGAKDADFLTKEFYPVFNQEDLVNQPKFSMYLKLMIDGATSKPFSAISIYPSTKTKVFKNLIILCSRKKYGKSRVKVEEDIFSQSQINSSENKEQSLF